MDVAYFNAKARQDFLAKKINELQNQLESLRGEKLTVDDFLMKLEYFTTFPDGFTTSMEVPANIGQLTPSAPGPKSNRKNSKKEKVAETTRRLIETAGRPLSREELYPMLRGEGLVIDGNDPQMVLSTMLWRMKDAAHIVRLKGGGYWLEEKPWAPAKYDPVLLEHEGEKAYFDAGCLDRADGEDGGVDESPPEQMEDDEDASDPDKNFLE